jgi:hypothetical protein
MLLFPIRISEIQFKPHRSSKYFLSNSLSSFNLTFSCLSDSLLRLTLSTGPHVWLPRLKPFPMSGAGENPNNIRNRVWWYSHIISHYKLHFRMTYKCRRRKDVNVNRENSYKYYCKVKVRQMITLMARYLQNPGAVKRQSNLIKDESEFRRQP